MKILRTKDELDEQLDIWKQEGQSIGIVPTMGNLHAGHLSLLDTIEGQADKIITTIYVNPLQFAQGEDFEVYPCTHEADFAKLNATQKCDAVYVPAKMFGPDHHTTIRPKGVALGYETEYRPHFFEGVATIVFKLFQQTKANVAVFGEKDYQQLHVIKQMVKDLDLPIRILAGPTVREKDGLAMSSRNGYLSPEAREIAPNLYQAMQHCAAEIQHGKAIEPCLRAAKERVLAAGFAAVDYLSYCDAHTLAPASHAVDEGMLLAAVHLHNVRLIDQLKV